MNEHMPYTYDTRASQIEPEGEIDVEDAFSDHDIAYWVREGNRLIPATQEQIAAIQEQEALLRLAAWRSNSSTHRVHISYRQHIGHHMRHWLSLLLPHLRQPRAPNTPNTLPTAEPQSHTSRSETQQKAARERHL